jgi:hypothetical protein
MKNQQQTNVKPEKSVRKIEWENEKARRICKSN